MQRTKAILFITLIVLYAIVCFGLSYFHLKVDQGHPNIFRPDIENQERVEVTANFYRLGPNWIKLNKWGLYEMYLEGDGFERGLAHGKLTKELMEYQEDAFVEKIYQLIPSESYLKVLRNGIAWFNRDIEDYIPQEFKNEIYGISMSANSKFEFIGPAYRRMLNYHGAHDIGHALQNLALVGCTSFALHQNDSNNNLIIGRNFDFYVSDKFAENKIIMHINPDSGYEFTFITWASFIGVVSGMNDQGLTVTINAAKSDYPTKSAMPISLLAREILQYAANIEEAISIAKKRKLFVSESLHIGSANDNSSVIIEKTPDELAVYKTDSSYLVCTNHFQSELLGNTETNKRDMAESPSVYRYERCEELIAKRPNADYLQVAEILRDMHGKNNMDIGMCNEKAMNQMISHHSIIFELNKKLMWVSTSPFQLGAYLAYSTKDFIAFDALEAKQKHILEIDSLRIEESNQLSAEEFNNYLIFKENKTILQTAIFKGETLGNIISIENNIINSNPNYYYSYMLIGDYFYEHGDFKSAYKNYSKALELEIEHKSSKEKMQKRLKEISK